MLEFCFYIHIFSFAICVRVRLEEQCGEDDSQQAAEAMVQLSGVGFNAQQQQGSYYLSNSLVLSFYLFFYNCIVKERTTCLILLHPYKDLLAIAYYYYSFFR